MWYWNLEKDGVWKINADGTTDGRSLDHPEIVAWLAEGNTPELWEPTNAD